jgi:pimeloyl-ACP methyl ester carboxylesterase
MNLIRLLLISTTIIGLTNCTAQDEYRFVDLNGRLQHIRVKGTGKPTIVFVTGLAEQLINYDSIQNVLSKTTQTFSYDRAGIGKSEHISVERSIDNLAIELNQILTKEKIDPPYLLVGHSLGGFIIRYFNYLYPDKVTGMLFIDPSSEKFDSELRKGLNSNEIRKLDSLDYPLWTKDERVPLAIRSEYQNYKTKDKELIEKIRFPINKPLTIISSGKTETEKNDEFLLDKVDIWVNLHKDWIKEAPQIRHVITEKSGHYIHNEEPELVITELLLMLEKLKK